MRLRFLGPLQVRRPDGWMALGSRLQSTLLATVFVHAPAPVSCDRLAEDLWDGREMPRNPRKRVQTVWLLRSTLGDGAGSIRSTGHGYALDVEPDDTDVGRFEALTDLGLELVRDGHPRAASRMLESALRLWRGPSFADAEPSLVIAAEASRLEERKLDAIECRYDAELRCGRHRESVPVLQAMVRRYPLREHLCGELMLALYLSGRQAEALAAYRRTHQVLADDLGLTPTRQLQDLHERVLRADPALKPGASASMVMDIVAPDPPTDRSHDHPMTRPAQVPAALDGFVGREAELRTLTGQTANHTGVPRIAAIVGTAGIGKTALAVTAAHRMAADFPDGLLYVDLHGFGPDHRAVEPSDAVRGLLMGLRVPARHIPAEPDARSALYRSRLAGTRTLVVLDNARDAAQVRPLLPGTPGCVTFVTSRDELSSLVVREAATSVRPSLLTAAESRTLLVRRLGAERVRSAAEAVSAIVAACAGLPLALALVAARAHVNSRFPLAAIAAELDGPRLDGFTAPDVSTDLRAVLSWSYDRLDADAAKLFRMAGLHPGPHAGVPALAALLGVPERRARRAIRTLTGAHLLLETAPGRFSCHGLLRAYAAELGQAVDPEPERRAAVRRTLDHYLSPAFRRTQSRGRRPRP